MLGKLDMEAREIDEKMETERERRDKNVRAVWEHVKKDWEGGVREVVRDDGTGEAEERCIFVMPWDDVPMEEEGAEGAYGVQVRWVPLDV